nr:MAG TPA: hypothetical protein [Caudoviricetes sp.]
MRRQLSSAEVTTQQNISLPATGKAGGTHEMEISPDHGTTIPFCR